MDHINISTEELRKNLQNYFARQIMMQNIGRDKDEVWAVLILEKKSIMAQADQILNTIIESCKTNNTPSS